LIKIAGNTSLATQLPIAFLLDELRTAYEQLAQARALLQNFNIGLSNARDRNEQMQLKALQQRFAASASKADKLVQLIKTLEEAPLHAQQQELGSHGYGLREKEIEKKKQEALYGIFYKIKQEKRAPALFKDL
jgi:hypothetical protein